MFIKGIVFVSLTLYATAAMALSLDRMLGVTQRSVNEDVNDMHAEMALSGPTFTGCTSSQQRAITSAIDVAMRKQAEAYSYLRHLHGTPETDHAGWQRYTRWFGAYSRENYKHVLKVFDLLPDRPLDRTHYVCNAPECGSLLSLDAISNNACTIHEKGTWRVGICRGFWWPGRHEDDYAQTLVHESTHFHTGTYNTKDKASGSASCLRFARDHPNEAITNADNYGYFAMNPRCSDSSRQCTIM